MAVQRSGGLVAHNLAISKSNSTSNLLAITIQIKVIFPTFKVIPPTNAL
jgi:hypothetical protein